MNKFFIFFSIAMLFFSGCIQINPTIESTKCYEGHFFDEQSAKNALELMKLEKNESVWILSNTTLKRVLKNCK